jgi:hypothetical protein
MAALTSNRVYGEGAATRFYVYRQTNVTSGDTLALSGDFARILAVSAFDETRSEVFFTPAIAGTTLTLTEASMANDTVYVFVFGAPA